MSYNAKPILLLKPTNSTFEIKETMNKFFIEWLAIHTSPEPKLLYHYTTLEGLKGIIENRSIWFSHISTLNDPLELQYGRQLILEEINKHIEIEKDEHIKELLKNLDTFITSFGERMLYVYITCFCEDENLLSQWRSYSADGGGYNLGISINSETKFGLNLNDLSQSSNTILRKVIYDPRQQKNIINSYISKIIDGAREAILRLNKENGGIPIAWEAQVAVESVNLLFDIMFCLKNEVFKEEKEWRFIKVSPENINSELVNFRGRNENLIPYFNTFIYNNIGTNPIFPLKKIMYGPLLEETRTRMSLDLFIRSSSNKSHPIKLKYEDIQIRGSGYTLRANR